ncbi:prepilin-type N-terminal cleavage/methylation domain-containing protein [Haloferula luteola]|uniref:Prepilin-type N-terminal cleavage/methylation domain-containing protein n=1 Tax=Haloferula luteola TaxID=595692 RepID=A0A840VDB0_9BACT|nr:type II secretion system protein [Haloferula luteola]MBB5353494.1 prepilin-type N-terminal cleavage/methylation domain-containing protein [Haloferula luteola]
MRAAAKDHRPGFTLTEMLVVVGILAAIAGLSFPLVHSALRSAHRVHCVSNLRQIGVGLEVYLQDHGKRMPDLATGRESRDEREDVIEVALADYLSNPDIFYCHADEGEYQRTGSSYAWNSVVSGRLISRLEFFGSRDEKGIPLVYDKENWHEEGGDEVGTNILYADGGASNEINFSIDE